MAFSEILVIAAHRISHRARRSALVGHNPFPLDVRTGGKDSCAEKYFVFDSEGAAMLEYYCE